MKVVSLNKIRNMVRAVAVFAAGKFVFTVGKFVFTAGMIVLAAGALTAVAGDRAPEARRVMNVVNFVRGCEPRYETDLVKPLVEEVALNTKYHFPNTILMQYDAMLRDDLMQAAKAAEPELTEYGVWFENCRALVEKVGLKWRGREGWDWDWYINPGFLMAYTHAEREKLIDEVFRLFREKFGANPKSVGSWLLDAYSMDYMVRKYGVKGFCICREQDNTDAYGLRGGYFNGAYYPSKKNMLSAAGDMANAVQAPVFKMLTPDPIYNYAKSIVPDRFQGCPTLEPVWASGQATNVVDWYFRVYTGAGLLNLSYMQTGQENSFGWDAIGKGLPYQAEVIAKYRAEGKLTVERMCDTAERFVKDHPCNCPQTQVALEDWNGKAKSVWYNSRCYRANLLLEGGKLRFRDLHKMCDDFEEPFLDKACTGWQALYFTPPVADEYLFRTTGRFAPLEFEGACTGLKVETLPQEVLKVTATFAKEQGGTREAQIWFGEGQIDFDWGAVPKGLKSADYEFNGYRYRIQVERRCTGVRLDLSTLAAAGDESVLPDWADARINEAVARYLAWKGNDETIAFTFMTDVHSYRTNINAAADFTDTRYHVRFAQALADRAGCDFLVDAGDHDFDNGCQSPAEALARMASTESVYHDYSTHPVLFCLGNHDHGPYPPGGGERPISSALYGETFNGLAVRHGFALTFGDNRSWGYYDVPGKRFRAIFCNTSDDCYYGVSQAQLDFLAQALADLPNGWTAAVFSHYCIFDEIGHWKHFQQGGGVVHKAEFMKVLEDFAQKRPNVLAGIFCGDSHFDNALECHGVNWTISQGYGGVSQDNVPWGARTVGFDRSREMLFELVAVKPKTGQFRLFRVGAGGAAFDRTCDYFIQPPAATGD